MITNQLGFLLKLLILSGLLSVLIKDVAPIFPIRESLTNVLIMVLLPTILMIMALLWRIYERDSQVKE